MFATLTFVPTSFGYCIICPSLIYGGFLLPLWYLKIVLAYKYNQQNILINSLIGVYRQL